MEIIRTNNSNLGFRQLVDSLDAELAIYDGDQHDFYHQYNGLEGLNNVVLIIVEDKAFACGAFKRFDDTTVEIKRMYVAKSHRGKGISTQILHQLEHWAKQLGFKRVVLETGKRQTEAMGLYASKGYSKIKSYEPYVGVENSQCFEKYI